jgi:Leucine-rich repeat (LRR) protein
MDVFRALDEAEKADRSFPNRVSTPVAPEQAARSPTEVKERDSMPQRDPRTAKQNCIVALVIIVGLLAIAAIVLPFVIDYGRSDDSPSGGPSPSTPAPIPSTPTISPSPTEAPVVGGPTESPTTLRLGQFIQQYLVPISGEEVFQDRNSPQFRAGEYIADVDPFTSELTSVELLADRYAAITFYYATNGENWDSCSLGDTSCEGGQWLVGDVCGWFSVQCDDVGRISAILFGTILCVHNFDCRTKITSFFFLTSRHFLCIFSFLSSVSAAGNGLTGSLPFELSLLTEMTDFAITNNTITGTLPEAFGQNATNIRSLLLSGNDLEGTIPNDYLSNSPVQVVDLSDNRFTGTIPMNLGGGSSLQTLDLGGNQIAMGIPDMSSYTSLLQLSLESNALENEIPDSMYEMTTLEILYLNGNPLTGTLSGLISNLSALRELRIGDTQIEGFIPSELFSLPSLQELDISGARFTGQLSFGFANLAPTLQSLIVDNNLFAGTIPDNFGLLTNLNALELHGNGFTGSIAESICALALDILTADCNEITCDCCTECY